MCIVFQIGYEDAREELQKDQRQFFDQMFGG